MASKNVKYKALREERRRIEREAARRNDRQAWIVYAGIAAAALIGVGSLIVAVVMFIDIVRGA